MTNATAFNAELHPRATETGQFVDKQQSAPETTLTAEPSAADRLTEIYFARGYYSEQVARDLAERYLAEGEEAGVDAEFLIEYVRASHLAREQYYLPTAVELRELGKTPADMAELIQMDDGKYRDHVKNLLTHGADAARIRELNAVGVNRIEGILSLAAVDDDTIAEWRSTISEHKELSRWAGSWAVVRRLIDARVPAKTAAAFALDGFVDPNAVARHPGKFTPTDADFFATGMSQGGYPDKKDADRVGRYLAYNVEHPDAPVSAADAKRYGPQFEPAAVAELLALEVEPRAARSLKAVERSMDAPEIATYVKAGITTGDEFRSWRDLTAPDVRSQVGSGRPTDTNTYSQKVTDRSQRILAAKAARVSVDVAAGFKKAGLNNPADWQVLGEAGITDVVEWFKPVGTASRSDTLAVSDYNTRESVYANALARFARAGGTPERLGVIQRAGIPITEAADHVKTKDLWAAGAANREAVITANKAEDARWGRTDVPRDWEWDEDTYTVV